MWFHVRLAMYVAIACLHSLELSVQPYKIKTFTNYVDHLVKIYVSTSLYIILGSSHVGSPHHIVAVKYCISGIVREKKYSQIS